MYKNYIYNLNNQARDFPAKIRNKKSDVHRLYTKMLMQSIVI